MRIDNWPLDRIMQLPDWCFGRRWLVGVWGEMANANPVFDIAELEFPDRAVIWEVILNQHYAATSSVEVTLALGNNLPANDAAFNAFDILFSGSISPSGRRGAFLCKYLAPFRITNIRKIIEAKGQNLVGRFIRIDGTASFACCMVVISSLPREVPDWLISGQASNLL